MTRVSWFIRIATLFSLAAFFEGTGAPSRDHAVGGFGQRVSNDDVFAGLGKDTATFRHIGASKSNDERDADSDFAYCLDDAFRHPVAAVDAGKNVDKHRLDIFVSEHGAQGLCHALG